MNRILVDASAAFDQRAGIGRYSRNILSRLVPAMPEVDFTLFHAPATEMRDDPQWDAPDGTRSVTYPLSRRRFDQLVARLGAPVPVRPFTGAQSLVYSPDFIAPPMRGVPRIVTVHDVAFMTHPHLTTPGTASFLRAALEREVRRGALIAAVSETTRERVVRQLNVSPERILVIPNGVDERFFGATPLTSQVLGGLGVPDRFLLMVGTIEPRKNHEGVVRAMALRKEAGLPLVIVGRPGWGTHDVARSLRELHESGSVVWLDDFPDERLPGLYASSQGVLYPSWTEGFGLPVLEALAAGRPVVTGNDPVFSEVGGHFVTQVDPGDAEALLEAIRLLETQPLDTYAQAARRAHAAQYSWGHSVTMLARWIRRIEEDTG